MIESEKKSWMKKKMKKKKKKISSGVEIDLEEEE